MLHIYIFLFNSQNTILNIKFIFRFFFLNKIDIFQLFFDVEEKRNRIDGMAYEPFVYLLFGFIYIATSQFVVVCKEYLSFH